MRSTGTFSARAADLLLPALRWVLIATVVGIPIFALGSFTNSPYDLPKLALLMWGVGLAGGLACARWVIGSGSRGMRELALPAAAFAIPLLVSWSISPHRSWALFGNYNRFTGLIPYVLIILLGILLVDAFRSRPDHLAWAMSCAGAIVGTVAFLQAVGMGPLWSPGDGVTSGSAYPPSTIGHFNFSGGFLAIVLPISLYVWSRATSPSARLFGIWATVAGALGLVLTNSQGGWAAGLAAISVMTGSFLSERWSRARSAGFLVAAVIACSIIGGVIGSLMAPDVAALGGTVRTRGMLWVTALEMGADAPVAGHGPAAYALEGVRYRSLDSVLAEQDRKADEPHSVPLAFWANSGALGAAGFAVFLVWLAFMGARILPGDHRSMAFFAAVVAYLIQASVSIDVIVLRVGLWVALAGLVISSKFTTVTQHGRVPVLSHRRRSRAVAAVLGLVISGTGVWYGGELIRADHRVASGLDLFDDDDRARGRLEFRGAIGFRYEPEYLKLFGDALGTAGLKEEDHGDLLIDEMKATYAYLEGFPETFGLQSQARILHHWSYFEPSASYEAALLLERARALDPNNPEIDIRLAETLVVQGDSDGARRLLEGWRAELQGELGTFWGALSTILLLNGDDMGARAALQEALTLDPFDCRSRMARLMLDAYEDPGNELAQSEKMTFQLNCTQGDYNYLAELMAAVDR